MTNEGQPEAAAASPEGSHRQEPSGAGAPVPDADRASPDAGPAEVAAQPSSEAAEADVAPDAAEGRPSPDAAEPTSAQAAEPAAQEDETAPADAADAEVPDDAEKPHAEDAEPSAPAGDETQAHTPSEEVEKEREKPKRPTLIVRYGAMGLIGRFIYSLERWRRGQRVVIKSDRGMEIGTIVCRGSDSDDGGPKLRGEALRLATHVDEIEERHLAEGAQRELEFCRKRVAERKLPMKLVEAEHLFGGDRIVFYFLSESRVDFRALVRDLAREFQTRIEMRQIGVRDEARLLGDYERCGRPLCCRAWIKDLEPVSMKMAKVQKATLDPTKISGRCGRLMCCLRYEHATYHELAKNLPRKNTIVGTAQGRGKVVSSDVVTQMVGVLLEAGTRVNVPVESLIPPEEAPAPGRAAQRPETVPQTEAPPRVEAVAETTAEAKPETEEATPAEKPNTAGNGPERKRRGSRRRRSKRGGRTRGGGRKTSDAAGRTPNAAGEKPHATPHQGAKPRDSQGT